jgi:hypothetical protein
VQLMTMAGKIIFNKSINPLGNVLPIDLLQKPASGIYVLKIDGYAPIKLLVN